jgi:two-component system sensor histidine kinase KdpD
VSETAINVRELQSEPGRGDVAWPRSVRYALTLLLVAAATVLAFAFQGVVASPSLTLFYVLPVVIAATSFGWGPSLAATVLSVLAYDFFFTVPYFSLTIASPTDICDAVLLLAIGAIVSAVAGDSRRKALAARRSADQAESLRALAHVVIEGRPAKEVAEAAALALNRIFLAPAVIFASRGGGLTLVAGSGVGMIDEADREAALAAASARTPTLAGAYPAERARFDFWPVRQAESEIVIGLDFSAVPDGRARDPDRLVEIVGAYLALSGVAAGAG